MQPSLSRADPQIAATGVAWALPWGAALGVDGTLSLLSCASFSPPLRSPVGRALSHVCVRNFKLKFVPKAVLTSTGSTRLELRPFIKQEPMESFCGSVLPQTLKTGPLIPQMSEGVCPLPGGTVERRPGTQSKDGRGH